MTRSAPPEPFQHSNKPVCLTPTGEGAPRRCGGLGGLNAGIQRPSVGGFGQSPRTVERLVENKECFSGCLESFLRASNKKDDLL
uniref:Uncharacterized protein n=1 Tax=Bacillus subtilis TaxID=1423 RepID=Q9X400_BACIU|nr:unknown [Bacillus subtilis]